MRQAIEARNLIEVEETLDWLRDNRPGFRLTEGLILDIHRQVIQGLYACAGQFRNVHQDGYTDVDGTFHRGIYVEGATFTPAPAYQVRYAILELIAEYENRRSAARDKLELAARFYHRFLCIHPFCGGNGRVGRALLNLILRREGLLDPDLFINHHIKRRKDWTVSALHKADSGDLNNLKTVIHISTLDAHMDRHRVLLEEHDLLRYVSPTVRAALDENERLALGINQYIQAIDSYIDSYTEVISKLIANLTTR